MADPPKPYDALSLLFECAKHGGVEACVFYVPAGHALPIMDKMRRWERHNRGGWFLANCMQVIDNEGRGLRGEAAVLCIAAQRLSIAMPAQITKIAPGDAHPCMCIVCSRERDMRTLPRLLGEHPPNED